MMKRSFIFCFLLLSFHFFGNGQTFDRINTLVKERETLQTTYEKLNAQVKALKSKKPSPELQEAYDKFMAKDAELIKEIDIVQAELARQQKEIVASPQREKIKLVGKPDKAQRVLIDSLLNVSELLKTEKESLLLGNASIHSYQETLDDQLKTTAEARAEVQKELDSVKTDKFILARRNKILLYFNMGVGILLLGSLIYTLLGFRKKKKSTGLVSVQDLTPNKPRPITGFNQPVPRIAFEATFDTRLDKIEKLGKLREKGLLSEEEFLNQKKQILNSKND